MTVITRDIQERMNNVAYHFAHKIRLKVHEVLRQPKYRNRGLLEKSVVTDVIKANGYRPPEIHLSYLDYGEILAQRSPSWVKVPNIEKLTEWLDNRFDGSWDVPGYKNGIADNLPRHKKIERVAWAIAKDKRENDTWKKRPWKRESLRDVLKELNVRYFEEFDHHIERLMKEALEQGTVA